MKKYILLFCLLFVFSGLIYPQNVKGVFDGDPTPSHPFPNPSPNPGISQYYTFTPTYIGNGPQDPVIIGPGMGWVAYMDLATWEVIGHADLPNYWYDKFDQLIAGGCDHIYFRATWKEWTDFGPGSLGDKIRKVLSYVDYYNEGKEYEKRIKVFFSIIFANTCNSDDEDFPYECGLYENDNLDVWSTAYDCSNCSCETGEGGLKELRYDSPNVPYIVSCWDDKIVNFVKNFDCIKGVDVGIMGNFGENHLLEYERLFKQNDETWSVTWRNFLSYIKPLFSDFKSKMDALNLITFFPCNASWFDSEGGVRGVKMTKDMFSMALDLGYTLRRSEPEGGIWPPDHKFNIFFKEYSIESGKGICMESGSIPIEVSQFKDYFINYCQLNMISMKVHEGDCGCENNLCDIYQWGLPYAVYSLCTEKFNALKNKLGYRFRVNKVEYYRNNNTAKLKINLSNLAYGFCSNPTKVEIVDEDGNVITGKMLSSSVLSRLTSLVPPRNNIRGLLGNYTIYISCILPTDVNNVPKPFGIKFYVKEKKTGTWVNIALSNSNGSDNIPAKTLIVDFNNN